MKALVLVLALSLLPTACAPPPTVVTQAGKTAYTADQVVVRVNELMNAAIAANAAVPPVLTTAATRTIVQFCVAADKTLAQAPAGWPQTVGTAWAQTKARLPVITNPAISAAINAVDVVLAATGGN